MKNNLPKVLMLGWEFPPVINGGLGVACHDLSGALSDLADITMIVPKSSPGFKLRNMNLVGINQIDPAVFKSEFSSLPGHTPFKLHEIPGDLNPYLSSASSLEQQIAGSASAMHEGIRGFEIDDLYGGDVIAKVMQYADIAAALATKMHFDVIHAHDWMTMIAGMRIREQSGKPLVIHIHSLEIDRGGEDSRGWVYELEKKGMQEADLLMPVSEFTAGIIEKYYGIPRSKMAVIHNGSRKVRAFKSRRKYDEKTVLFVGRLTRQKGPERFLEIADRVLQKNPDVRFVMAGVGDHFRSCLEKSSNRHIGNRFHMTGFLNLEKLRYLFSISDVYCMPSVSEPFGLSAVEAAQFGIPCVISQQSGVAEVLTGSMKFDHWDINKASDCILNILQNQVLREKIITDACLNLEGITWEASAKKIINAYSHYQFI